MSGHPPLRGSGQSSLLAAATPKEMRVSATVAKHSVLLDAQKPTPHVVVQSLQIVQIAFGQEVVSGG